MAVVDDGQTLYGGPTRKGHLFTGMVWDTEVFDGLGERRLLAGGHDDLVCVFEMVDNVSRRPGDAARHAYDESVCFL